MTRNYSHQSCSYSHHTSAGCRYDAGEAAAAEEPDAEEFEFSDDEAEAAWRREQRAKQDREAAMTNRRGGRAGAPGGRAGAGRRRRRPGQGPARRARQRRRTSQRLGCADDHDEGNPCGGKLGSPADSCSLLAFRSLFDWNHHMHTDLSSVKSWV